MTQFSRFSATIAACRPSDFHDEAGSNSGLILPHRSYDKVRTYYAPFDHVNRDAKLVLVGITPGRDQMNKALRAACTALRAGCSEAEALAAAKREASFGGKMRKNLVRMLDHYGVNRRFGLATTNALWDTGNNVAHFTSALRNPVFYLKDGKETNYSGNTPVLASYSGFQDVLADLSNELAEVENSLIVPLGSKVAGVIEQLVTAGRLPLARVLHHDGKVAEVPHPSGQNGEPQKLVLMPQLPSMEEYVRMKLKAYRVKKAAEGEPLTAKQEEEYARSRCRNWTRAVHNRAALEAIST